MFQDSRHETIGDTVAVAKILLAALTVRDARGRCVHRNNVHGGNYFRYPGRWHFGSGGASRSGAPDKEFGSSGESNHLS
jgi:hypothetical protein